MSWKTLNVVEKAFDLRKKAKINMKFGNIFFLSECI